MFNEIITVNKKYLILISKCIHRKSIVALIWLLTFIYLFYISVIRSSYYTNEEIIEITFKTLAILTFYLMCQFFAILFIKFKDKSLLPKYETLDMFRGALGAISFFIFLVILIVDYKIFG